MRVLTNSDLYRKIFKADARKYRLLFFCNSFVVMIQCFFTIIISNEAFMNPTIVDSVISSNIYLPTVIIYTVSLFFIPYSHFTFNKQRRMEYGILEAIGLDKKNIREMLIQDNVTLAASSLVVGFIVGTLFALIFILGVNRIIGIEGLVWEFNIKAYTTMGLFLVVVYGITIIIDCIIISKSSIRALLNDDRRIRRGHKPCLVAGVIGVVLLLIPSAYLLFIMDQEHNNYLIVAFMVMMIGTYIIIDNSMLFTEILKKKDRIRYYKSMLAYTGIGYRFQDGKKVIFFTICLLSLAIYFQAFSLTTKEVSYEMVEKYNPHQIIYCELEGINNISDEEFQDIIVSNNIQLKYKVSIPYVVSNGMTIISANDASNQTNRAYNIKQGECAILLQYDEKDGYQHDTDVGISALRFNSGLLSERIVDVENDIITGVCNSLPERIAVLCDDDFRKLYCEGKEDLSGMIHFIDCESDKESVVLGDALRGAFAESNSSDDDTAYYKPLIQSEAYDEDRQSSVFLIFVLAIVGCICLLTSVVITRFKLALEEDYDRKKYMALLSIGYSKAEIKRIVVKEMSVYLIIPVIVSTTLSGIMSYALMNLSDKGLQSIGYTLLFGGIIYVMQKVLCRVYSEAIITDIEKFYKPKENEAVCDNSTS